MMDDSQEETVSRRSLNSRRWGAMNIGHGRTKTEMLEERIDVT